VLLLLQRQLLNILLLLAGVAAAVIWAAAVLVDTELILDSQQHLIQITPLLLGQGELVELAQVRKAPMEQIQFLAQLHHREAAGVVLGPSVLMSVWQAVAAAAGVQVIQQESGVQEIPRQLLHRKVIMAEIIFQIILRLHMAAVVVELGRLVVMQQLLPVEMAEMEL
jgi:hypothetical protein